MSDVTLVGMLSTYREGSLAELAVESANRACDHVLIFEGPAGEAGEGPPTSEAALSLGAETLHGSWASDAAKRTAMVKRAQRTLGEKGRPLWGVWIDGDEVLINGEFLRDWLQAVEWNDEEAGGTPPTAGFPLRLVELDGTVMVCRAKCVRLDLIDRYVVSSSGIRFKNGVTMAEGNLNQKISEWWTPARRNAVNADRLMLEPPLPGEPFLLHRSPLRHPKRKGLRMHEQEARELERMGVLKRSPLDQAFTVTDDEAAVARLGQRMLDEQGESAERRRG